MKSNEFRDLGHRVVDLLSDYLEDIEGRPVFPKVEPRTLHQLFDESLPEEPTEPHNVLQELEDKLLPYCTHVGHPGYMGLITPSPNPIGIIGDFICSAFNQNIGTYTIGPAGVAMERRTVRWLTDLAGYGDSAGGNLSSGGMVANLIGLKLARRVCSHGPAQHAGLPLPSRRESSEGRHVSVDKAVGCEGMGRSALRPLRTDDQFQMRVDALEQAIADDKRKNIRPMCIVGIFGTTNTGAVDPIRELRRVADREG